MPRKTARSSRKKQQPGENPPTGLPDGPETEANDGAEAGGADIWDYFAFMRTVREGPTTFFWTDWIQDATVSVLQGLKGQGKSSLLSALLAYRTGGPPLPGMRRLQPAPALLLTREASYENEVKPRLVAHGADYKLVLQLARDGKTGGNKRVVFPDDKDLVIDLVRQTGCGLIGIDPISSFNSRDYDIMTQPGARGVAEALAEIAQATRTPVLYTQHCVKNCRGPLINHGQGHADLVNVARHVMRAFKMKDGSGHVLASVASNLGSTPKSLRFKIVPKGKSFAVSWEGPCDLTAEDAAEASEGDTTMSKRELAMQVLEVELRHGPRKSRDVLGQLAEAGCGKDAIDEARVRLGVRAFHKGSGDNVEWYMCLAKHFPKRGGKRS